MFFCQVISNEDSEPCQPEETTAAFSTGQEVYTAKHFKQSDCFHRYSIKITIVAIFFVL